MINYVYILYIYNNAASYLHILCIYIYVCCIIIQKNPGRAAGWNHQKSPIVQTAGFLPISLFYSCHLKHLPRADPWELWGSHFLLWEHISQKYMGVRLGNFVMIFDDLTANRGAPFDSSLLLPSKSDQTIFKWVHLPTPKETTTPAQDLKLDCCWVAHVHPGVEPL